MPGRVPVSKLRRYVDDLVIRFWLTKRMLLVNLGLGRQSVEEFLQAGSWSSALVGAVLSESDDVGAGGCEDVLDVGLCQTAVPAVA